MYHKIFYFITGQKKKTFNLEQVSQTKVVLLTGKNVENMVIV
jgi:hypothetical protein